MLTLDPVEVRVLGCLVEKQLATPEYYPMTLNALKAACNQKTNRDPVTAYADEQIGDALAALQRQRLAGVQSGAGMRTTKYRHTLTEALGLEPPSLAVLAELMLRGPQTLGVLRARAGRMYELGSLEAVESILDGLAVQEQPLVAQLPRLPGQKEVRYAQLLSGEPEVGAGAESSGSNPDRTARLEQEVADLRARLQALEDQFTIFRQQFE